MYTFYIRTFYKAMASYFGSQLASLYHHSSWNKALLGSLAKMELI